ILCRSREANRLPRPNKFFVVIGTTFGFRRNLNSSLSGVECQLSSGAKHRFATTTKLNAGSRLYRSHRSGGLHPGYKLLRRLLSRTIARTFTDTQSGSNLLRLRRLEEVLKVTVLREDIVQSFVHNIVG